MKLFIRHMKQDDVISRLTASVCFCLQNIGLAGRVVPSGFISSEVDCGVLCHTARKKKKQKVQCAIDDR
jgi:hypothetical protein